MSGQYQTGNTVDRMQTSAEETIQKSTYLCAGRPSSTLSSSLVDQRALTS